MAQINFYHLTRSPLGKALPRLLEKVLASNLRALVLAANDQRVEELNKELWTYTTKTFLPHGSKDDGFADQQPIYLTSSNDNPNGATVLVMVDNQAPEELSTFEKCLYMFDGNNPEHVAMARKRWKEFLAQGHTTIYWQQDDKGAWQKGGA